jgi:alkylhydroperoxidase family enzyme
MTMSLVPPLTPPYAPDTEAMLKRWMPPGAPFEPLALFRSLAKNDELMKAMRGLGSYFLGPKSILPVRFREMLILRTCAKAACEYEWGVHVTAFAHEASLSAVDIQELTFGAAESPHWSAPEQAILSACDQLMETTALSPAVCQKLKAHFGVATILAIICLLGWYRLIAGLANTVCEQGEPWADTFAAYR